MTLTVPPPRPSDPYPAWDGEGLVKLDDGFVAVTDETSTETSRVASSSPAAPQTWKLDAQRPMTVSGGAAGENAAGHAWATLLSAASAAAPATR